MIKSSVYTSLGRECFDLIVQRVHVHRPIVQSDLLIFPESANSITNIQQMLID